MMLSLYIENEITVKYIVFIERKRLNTFRICLVKMHKK